MPRSRMVHTRQYGVCRILHQQRIASDTTFGARFTLFGVADSWREAHLCALFTTVQCACSLVVVCDALQHGVWRHMLRNPCLLALWWDAMFSQPGVWRQCTVFAPTFFNMLKWKPLSFVSMHRN